VGYAGAAAARANHSSEGSFNQPGNILIADQFNNRVVELDAEILLTPEDSSVATITSATVRFIILSLKF
jgi:hypothetical protein